MTKGKLKFVSVSAMAVTLVTATHAWAQDTALPEDSLEEPKPAGDDEEANEAAGLYSNAIVVTAQRREQNLQETPVAVTALSPSTLEQLNIANSQDLMQVVPSLQVSTQTAGDGGGSATFFLRGMGQQRSGNGSEPAVGIYVDDFYYPSLQGNVFDIVDLAQVEVLRGPQGTLFGRNTIGGAIRYTTRGAELGEFGGHVTGTIGRFDRYEISGALNVPLGDFAAVRVTGGHLEQDGYVTVQSGGPDAGATETNLIRIQARIEPTGTIYADLSAQYNESRIDGFTYNVPGPLTPRPPAPGVAPSLPFIWNIAVAPAIGAPSYTDAFASDCFYCQFGTRVPEFSETTYKNALATVGWDVAEGVSLKSLTGWQEVESSFTNDLDSTPLPIFENIGLGFKTKVFSQEIQLNIEAFDDRLNLVGGAFYYNERNPGQVPEVGAIVLGNPGGLTPTDRDLKSYAGFIDGSFEVTDRLTLLGGFRYSEDHKDVRVFNEAGTQLDEASGTFDSTTYRVGLQYQWTPDIMTYANVASGFRGGGFNPYQPDQLAFGNPALIRFDPETSTSYEVGARMQFLDRRVTINPTAFYVDWSDIQVQRVEITFNSPDIILENAAAARSYGFELEWAVEPVENLNLFGNFSYLNLKYTDIGGATGITLDSEFQRAPEFSFAVGGSYALELASGAEIISTLNYSFQDDQKSTPTDSDALMLEAYGLLNGRIEFTDADKRFAIAAFVTNIFDEEYTIGGVNYYSNVGAARFDLGRPREFGVSARVNF